MNSNCIEKAIERYEELLEAKDNEISNLQEQVERLTAYADQVAWARHRKAKDLDLPVPRLQIELTVVDEHEHRWFYSLIYRHTIGDLMSVPIGETISRGGHKVFRFQSKEDAHKGIPYRDGVHIRRDAAQLNLPAYAIWKDKVFPLDPISEK